MNKRISTLLIGLVFSAAAITAQTARVQVIHNSADAAAATVDVWLNSTLLLDDFSFRNVSPFVDAPAGESFDITIQPPSSTDTTNGLWRKSYTLDAGEIYILVANGIISTTGYNPADPFDIYINPTAREGSALPGKTDVTVFHGSTDAPTVDVVEVAVPAGKIVDGISYGEFQGYLELDPAAYSLQIRTQDQTTVAQYSADISTLAGNAISVIASGFLNPAENSNGAAFGLFVATAAGGALLELPTEPVSTARVQVIHNSADLAADSVDVYLNDAKLLDNFAFRNASPFIDAPAGSEFDITIAPKTSADSSDGIWRKSYTLAAGEKYILVANGIVSGSGYSPVKPFDIYVKAMGQESAGMEQNSDVLVFHGSTDAPTVDVFEPYAGLRLVDDISYGDFQGYLELPTADYSLQIQTDDGRTPVAEFGAPLETLSLEGEAMVVVASGFLKPTDNSDGADFGLFVALPSGGELVALPGQSTATARAQVIHNAADMAADTVDIYLNDAKLIPNFAFRNASAFIDAPAGPEFDISVAPKGSSSVDEKIWSKSYTLKGDMTYTLIANGIVSESGYDPAEAFDIYVYDMARESAEIAGKTDVLVFHGSTDAPTVDIVEVAVPAGTIVPGASYGDFAGYLSLDPAAYSLQIRTEDQTTVAQFGADVSTLGDAAITIVASGFLNTDNNSGGEAFGLYVATAAGGEMIMLPTESISTARVQVIHNSADMAADSVDVYLNATLLLDNFAFRNASPFIDAPAGSEFDITIAPKTSADSSDGIWRKSYTLDGGEKYILVANGIVSATGYDPVKGFDIYVQPMAKEAAGMMDKTDVLVFHGATDAPMVDIVEVGVPAGTLVPDLSYGDFAGYLSLDPMAYSLQIRTQDQTAVAQYSADISGLGGAAITVLASGFLNPAMNSNGEAFGLFVATAEGGELIALPSEDVEVARVQVIHNSADMAADTVDVYLNETLLLDNFAFRTASPFVDAPIATEFDITIAPKTSSDSSDGIWKKSYTLESGETYILVANGIVSGSGYDPAEAFDIYVYGMGQETAGMTGNTDVLVFHGATDAPAVDVYEPFAGLRVVDDMAYGEFTGYIPLNNADYSLQIQTADGRTAVAQYAAPLESLGLADSALVVVASGFLAPANNSNGPAFGLFVALPEGGNLVELPSEDIASARVQVIHNSADAAASMVDVWYNDMALLPGFKFRTASPFIDVTAGTEFDISIQGAGSSDTTNAIWKKSYTLMGDMTYVLIANGIVSGSGYDPAKAFDIYVSAMGREMASTSGNTDLYVFHGSTDAPTVDIHEATAGELINNLEYGMFDADYLELPTADYIIEVRDETGMSVVASYQAPLATLNLNDSALVAVASGFLNPANNSNGPAFGIWVALPMGGDLIELPAVTTSVNDISFENIVDVQVYPNPVSSYLNVNFTLEESGNVEMAIIGITGQTMLRRDFGSRNAGEHFETLNMESLQEGIYMLRMKTGNNVHTERIKVLK